MRKWLPLVTICLGTFMLLVDVTIVNVALPDMATSLKSSFTSLQWVVDGYALALAALVLGTGSIADLFGHRRLYITGLALFAVSSFVCGVAPNVGVLITARFTQGVGAAAMLATTFALLNSSYAGRDRGTAYGMWGAVAGASSAVGPILGGLLTQAISWRWIFFVNLPVSVAAIAMSLWVLSGDVEKTKVRIDFVGMVVFTGAAGGLTYGMIQANEHSWTSAGTLGALIAGAALLALFVAVESRSDHAMFDMALLRSRSFVGVLIAALLLNFAAFAYLTYTSIWLQSVLGLSPIEAGLTGLPLSAGAFIVSAGIGRFLHNRNPGPIIGLGMVLVGVGGLVSALVVHGSGGWAALIPGYLIVGVGVGFAMPTLSSAGMSAVPVQRGGMAAGAINSARQLGYAFGIAVLGSFFAARAQHVLSSHGVPAAASTAHRLAGGQAQVILGQTAPARRSTLNHLLHTASVSGLDATFVVAGVAAILAGLAVFLLFKPAPAPKWASEAKPAATSPAAAA